MKKSFITSIFSGDILNSLLVFGLKVGGGLSGYLLFALVARLAGAEEFGKFSILFSIVMIIGTAGSMGQQVFLVKEVPVAQRRNDWRLERDTYAYSFGVTLLGASIGAFIFVLVAAVLFPTDRFIGIAGGIFCFAYALSQTTVGALRIQDRIVYAIATRDLVWRVTTALIVVILPWFILRLTATSVVLTMALSLLVVVTWHLVVVDPQITVARINLSGADTRRWLKLSGAFTIVAVISSADLYLYSIALGFIVPASEVGPFFASLKTVEVINLFLMSVSLVVGPRIARAVAGRHSDIIQAECNFAIFIQGIPALFACSVMFVLGPFFLSLFDPSFVDEATLLRVLAVGVLFNALTGSTVLLLQLVGLHWQQVIFQGASLALGVTLVPLLVPHMGLIGAGIAYVISKVLWNVLAVWSIRRSISVDPSCLGLFGSGALTFRLSVSNLRKSLGLT